MLLDRVAIRAARPGPPRAPAGELPAAELRVHDGRAVHRSRAWGCSRPISAAPDADDQGRAVYAGPRVPSRRSGRSSRAVAAGALGASWDRTVVSWFPPDPSLEGGTVVERRRRARRRPDRPRARPGARRRTRKPGSAWRVLNYDEDEVGRAAHRPAHDARPVRRRRPRQPALRRLLLDPPARRTGCASARPCRSRRPCASSPGSRPRCSASPTAALLAEGRPADVVVFDPATVGAPACAGCATCPAGADRLVADAHGIDAVVVNGRTFRRDGADVVDPNGPLPGRLLRSGSAS